MQNLSYTLQLFSVGVHQFAIRESDIATVADWREPTPLPHAPPAVLGVVSLQGRMLTILDLGKINEGEKAAGNGTPQHIIALRGDEQLALAVDRMTGKAEISAVELEVKPDTSAPTVGVLEHEGKNIQIVNVKGLFSSAIQGRERRRRQF